LVVGSFVAGATLAAAVGPSVMITSVGASEGGVVGRGLATRFKPPTGTGAAVGFAVGVAVLAGSGSEVGLSEIEAVG